MQLCLSLACLHYSSALFFGVLHEVHRWVMLAYCLIWKLTLNWYPYFPIYPRETSFVAICWSCFLFQFGQNTDMQRFMSTNFRRREIKEYVSLLLALYKNIGSFYMLTILSPPVLMHMVQVSYYYLFHIE